jgi:glyoxylase-like metal-dependent hydrolase (beta-lactamase superfamily II)
MSGPMLRRVLAPNPGPLTGEGTNTWILGQGTGVAVIDPGPDDARHLAALLGALAPGEGVGAIVVTHAHRDHSAGAAALAAATGAPVHAFGGAMSGRNGAQEARGVAAGAGDEGRDEGFAPDLRLADGDQIAGPGWRLIARHTPGHMGGHLCLDAGEVLFSGDHVMGWSTTVVAPPDGCMGDYMASLRELAGGGWRRMLPGHGLAVEDWRGRVAGLIAHREGREAAILAALAAGGAMGATALAGRVYAGLAPALLPAAARNVLAHLLDLEARGAVAAQAPGPADLALAWRRTG